jgi:AraC-like DNA-binding protein
MGLVVAPSSLALAPFVESFGYFAGPPAPHRRERILPGGWTDVMVNLSADSAVLAGPTKRFKVIETGQQRELMSVHFRLGGAVPFFPVPISAVTETAVDLADLWGRDGAVLAERLAEAATPARKLQLLEGALLAHAGTFERDPAMERAIQALERGIAVRDVVERFGTTAKPFVRRFTERVGLTPKRFARVRRLQRVLASVSPQVDWAEVAASHGYFDQSHLIQDFRDLTGLTPTEYRPRSPDERNHVPLSS